MQINHLRYFIALSDHLSITKASSALNTTPQNVSRVLKSLEVEINALLYNRTSEGVTLTLEGREFLQFAKSTVYQFDKLESSFQFRKKHSEQSFNVTLYSNNFINEVILNDVLMEFQQTYPNISINNLIVDWKEGYQNVSDNPSDIAFLNYFPDRSEFNDLIAIPALHLQPVAIMSKNHPLANLNSCYKKQLRDYRLVIYTRKTLSDTDVVHSLQLDPTNKQHSFIGTGNIKSCYQMVSTGSYITMGTLESFLAQEESVRCELKAIPLLDRPRTTCALIKSPNLPQDSPQQLLISYILNYIQEHPLNSSIQ